MHILESHKTVRSKLCHKGSRRLVCTQPLSPLCIHTLLPSSQCALSLPLHFGLGHWTCFTRLYIRREETVFRFLSQWGLTHVHSASQVSAVAMRTCSHGDCWAFSLDSRVRCVGGPGPQVWWGKQCHPHPSQWRSTEPLKTHRHGSKDRYLVLKPLFGGMVVMQQWVTDTGVSNWPQGWGLWCLSGSLSRSVIYKLRTQLTFENNNILYLR